jgi:hypothetical protein
VAACSSSARSESRDVVYDLAGTDATIPHPPGTRVFTLGIEILNRSDEDVEITSFRPVDVQGLSARPTLVVGTPRHAGNVASAVGFPPTTSQLPQGSRRPLRYPVRLPAGATSAHWGVVVLTRVVVSSAESYLKGYRVEGRQGTHEFQDFVDASVAFCESHTGRVDQKCRRFAAQVSRHGG